MRLDLGSLSLPSAALFACALALVTLPFAGAGCEAESSSGETTGATTAPSSTSSTAPCSGADTLLADGRCQPPGLPLDMACPPGETPLPDGSCQPAGVPPSACGDGFEPDGKGGCAPVLPEEPCPEGLMAVPGDPECREIAPCGAGTWGDIPIEPGTQFVDSSYPGGDSDGSQEKPWTTIGDAMTAGKDGALIAVAEGEYMENLEASSKSFRIWGVCPSKVSLHGVSADKPAFMASTSGCEIHTLAITGPFVGVQLEPDRKVVLDRLWIHDTAQPGVLAFPNSHLLVTDALVERTIESGIQSRGGTVEVDRCLVRDVEPGPTPFGILVDVFSDQFVHGDVTVEGSLLENVYLDAASAVDADLTLDRTAVRRMRPDVPLNSAPRGGVQSASGLLTVKQSTFDGMPLGVFVSGSYGTLEHVTITGGDAVSPQYPSIKAGVYVQEDPQTFNPASLVVRESTVARQREFGVGVDEGKVTLVSSLLLENVLEDEGAALRAVYGDLTITRTAILDSRHSAVTMEGTNAVFEASLVRGVTPTTHAGYGISVWGFVNGVKPVDGSLTMTSSLVEDCHESALAAIESTIVLDTSILRAVKPRPEDGLFGDGFVLMSKTPGRGTAKITGSLVDSVARAGIAAFGSTIDLGQSASLCATFALAGEELNGVPFQFNKTGDDACGCPAAVDLCKIESPGLTPPTVQ